MQDCYVGDIGDFGKYGLLRWLCGMFDDDDPLSLGVLWYRYISGGKASDASYLDRAEAGLRDCDPALFNCLREIVKDERSVAAIERSGVLPDGALCYPEPLQYVPWEPREVRAAKRLQWIAGATRRVADSELVFTDPDTGLEVPSVDRFELGKKGRDANDGREYAYYDDLIPHWKHGKSLVVYQHLRSISAKDMFEKRRGEFKRYFSEDIDPIVLWWHRGTARLYFILPAPAHEKLLKERISALLESDWGKQQHGFKTPHFELVE